MKISPKEDRSWRFALVMGVVAACCACSSVIAEAAEGIVHGRVSGQDDAGEHRGPVAGAKVEFAGTGGAAAGSATSDANGYYRVEGLAQGNFTYRIVAEGYAVEEKGRGFSLPAGDEAYVLDFILAKEGTEGEKSGAVDAGRMPGVHGRVTGQDDRGEHLGPLAGTIVEFLIEGGAVAASTETNEHGYYRFDALGAGSYTYRLTAAGYRKEEEGRGFELRADAGMQVLDFILSKGSEEKEKPGRLSGHVWVERQEGRQPVAGARVTVVNDGEGRSAAIETDRDGFYEFLLPVASWRAAAMAEPYGSKVHPEVIAIAPGGEERVDFVFTEETMACPEVYILAAVERGANEAGEAPQLALLMGPEGSGSGEVTGVRIEDLGADPRGSDFFRRCDLELDDAMEGEWRWYLASYPACAVVPGLYHAAGALAGYHDDMAGTKTAGAHWPTIFDLVFERVRPEVEVLVETKAREPLAEVEVKFVNRSLGRSLEEAIACVTDEEGMSDAVLEDGLGEYNVMLMCEGYEPQVRTLVADGESHQLRVQMFRTGEIPTVDLAGVVIEAMAGEPAAVAEAMAVGNAFLTITPGSGQALPPGLSLPIVTGADGGFKAKALAEGDYAVSIGAEGYESWEGTLSVELGMGPAILELEPINTELENHIRMILTEGWGPSGTAVAQRHYQLALKEDPEDCRVDYAMALAFFSAANMQGALAPLGAAVGKKDGEIFWDRSCEARIWLQMFLKAVPVASQEILALCQHHYADREPNAGSLETAFVLGVAVGVLNGPWNSQESALQNVELDAACMAALQDPYRSEYVRGKQSVASGYGQLAQQEEAAKKELMEGAAAEQARMAEAAMSRIGQIDVELGQLQSQITLNTNQFSRNWQGFNLIAEQQKVQGMVMSINNLNAQKAQTYDCGCGQHAGYLGDCPSCVANYQRKCVTVDNQVRIYNQQYQQAIAQLQALEARYNHDLNALNGVNAQLNSRVAVLQTERRQLEGQANARPDIEGMMEREARKFDEAKKAFIKYRTYPLEERKAELLNNVGR